jgi:hypothetical protein
MATSKNLLATPAARRARSEQKRSAVLRFLRQEIWSSQVVLCALMGLESRTSAHKALTRMEADELLRRHTVTALGGGHLTLWGITAHGQAMAFDPATEAPLAAYFEPSKVAEPTIKHGLDLQWIRVYGERAGWHSWINGDRLPNLLKGGKRPDAIAVSPTGQKTAFEIERTIKTTKRYEQILASYLMALKAEQIHQVLWLSPTADVATRLQKIIFDIQTVTIQKQRFTVDPQRHHSRLMFRSYSEWEEGIDESGERI